MKQAHEPISAEMNRIAQQIVDSAYHVHRALGPGLLENVYEVCLTHELGKRGLQVERQVAVPVIYDGVRLDVGYRLDLLGEGQVVVELKAVESILPLHKAQVLTYLKLSGRRLGFLINFDVPLIKDDIERLVW
jgi:GxxExxY protein